MVVVKLLWYKWGISHGKKQTYLLDIFSTQADSSFHDERVSFKYLSTAIEQ